MAYWHIHHGSWWALQWCADWFLSFGIHADLKHRSSPRGPYGPYLDLHLGLAIVSLGYWPVRAVGSSIHPSYR